MTEDQYDEAKEVLFKVLESQQKIPVARNVAAAETMANFCIKFMETYAAWLDKKGVLPD